MIIIVKNLVDQHEHTKGDQRGGQHVGTAVVHIDHLGVILRHIDHLGVGWLDDHRVAFDHDGLGRATYQGTGIDGPGAHGLDRSQNVIALGQHGGADGVAPVHMKGHSAQDIREGDGQNLDACIVFLALDGGFQRRLLQIGIVGQKPVGLDDLQRVGGRDQHLDQQGVGIERDRRHQVFQLGLGQQRGGIGLAGFGFGGFGRCGGFCIGLGPGHWRGAQHQPDCQAFQNSFHRRLLH